MGLRLCHDDHILVKIFEDAALSASGDSLRKLLITAFRDLSDAERIEYRLAGIARESSTITWSVSLSSRTVFASRHGAA